MTNMADFFDFNDAGEQRSFDVIPDNTIVTVQLTVRPGGAGDDGWLRRSKDGACEMVNCEFTVVDGPYAKRKVFQLYTVRGTTPGHAEAAVISRQAFCAMLESARGIRPDDKSDAANAARHAQGWQDLDQLRLVARLGVRPPQDGYAARNTIKEIVTPERQAWTKPEQIARDPASKPATSAPAPAAAPTPPPANAITRPNWAQPAEKK
jgi:hypothetical protein